MITTCANNNAVITNNYKRLQGLILLFKIPHPAHSKFIDDLGTAIENVCQA